VTQAIDVTTTRGAVRGTLQGRATAFRGIRYAEPPIRQLRFAPPRPVAPWTGVHGALRFGPACPQVSRTPPGQAPFFGGLFGPGEHGTDEDCLTLNIWTPSVKGDGKPVMVFIHGGAFRIGSGTAPTYDGTRMAERGDVVVVTLNYRLGVLGFLHVPELGSVNLGLQDQLAALRWVAEEVAAFGGDPGNVTVFGESAGAKSIECLLASPHSHGLVHRAILQSTYDPPLDSEQASATAWAVASAIGVSDLEQLREVPVERLLTAVEEVQAASGPDLYGAGLRPVVDGEVLPEVPLEAARAGRLAPVSLVIGTNLDEARLFGALMGAVELDDDQVAGRIADAWPAGAAIEASEVMATYRKARTSRGQLADPVDLWLAFQTDRMFRQHSVALAAAHAEGGNEVWMYLFTRASPVAGGLLGSCHALELPFVFGTLDGPTEAITERDPAAERLSDRMQHAWLSFAREGSPGSVDGLDWPRYDAQHRRTMQLGDEVQVIEDPESEERVLWVLSAEHGDRLAPR